jgi:hypothetical protein
MAREIFTTTNQTEAFIATPSTSAITLIVPNVRRLCQRKLWTIQVPSMFPGSRANNPVPQRKELDVE